MTLSLALFALAQASQTPVATVPEEASGLEIHRHDSPHVEVVTVRGRRESRFDAPVAAVTLPGTGLANVDDVVTAVPGVWMVNDQDPGTNILSIRGATTDRLQQASVAMVLDGVPLADTELFTPRLFDVVSVEVLKGPQGALYGKNAAGGVIGIRTRLEGSYLGVTAGNGGLAEIDAAHDVALGDRWTLRAAGLWSQADGWIKNTTLNRLVDAVETRAGRLRLSGTALGWQIDTKFQYLEDEGGAAWASSNNVTGKAKGRLSGAVLMNPIGDYPGSSWRRWGQGSVLLAHPWAGGTVSVMVARDSYAKRWDEELDYRPGPLTFFGFPAFPNGIQPIRQPIDIAATTAEVRWISDGADKLTQQWGAFLQKTDKDRTDDFGPLLFGAPAPRYLTRSNQISAYGALGYRVSPVIKLEVQGRFDRDDRSQTILSRVNGPVISRREGTFERFQPRMSLQWLKDGQNLFVSYGEAFRPGGFNPTPAASSIWQATYRPEITSSLELGWKQRLPIWAGQFELNLFSNQVEDYQNYTFIDNQSVTLNVDEVTVKGWEASLAIQPVVGLDLAASYALADTKIQRFIATDPLLGSPATRDYSGKAIPNAPRDTGRVTARYGLPLGGFSLTGQIAANYAGKTYYEIDNVLYSPARWWTDLTVTAVHQDWTLSLGVQNLEDKRWAISAFGQGMTGLLAGLGPGGPFDTFTINRGRKVTLSLRREF
ncbi:pesticin receptor [Candidatus Phycosocius bacilliformis]|uniref:Pesticin receptor n=1 Tax=Candidatus Phycosocius bacilliformis TaxID=1445552 RepID=A0A2P2E8B7_9PROT|nr:TonB-dependent receptor [Candidatus Phycosocius bacilliformis]GBF57303.1 pesticin receptor [Candidatus Phycosocius bacilliformis]